MNGKALRGSRDRLQRRAKMDSAWRRPWIEKKCGALSEIGSWRHGRNNAAPVLRTLHDQVWAPIEEALPEGTKAVILSPDGELNFVSFATLLTLADAPGWWCFRRATRAPSKPKRAKG